MELKSVEVGEDDEALDNVVLQSYNSTNTARRGRARAPHAHTPIGHVHSYRTPIAIGLSI